MAKKTPDQPEIIYSMMRVSKFYNNKPVIKDISLSYFYGAKIGVLGLNGSGKSTVLRIMAGVDQDFNGEAVLSKGYTTGLLEQEPKLDDTKTVREIVEEGAAFKVALLKEYNEISELFGEPDADMDALLARQGELQDQIDTLDCWDLDTQLEQAMDALRCPDPETPVSVLSGGERRRVALCRLLIQQPDILLLDEPTNHLDAESVAWLELHLQRYEGTVIAITHDRYFLDHVAEWILELDGGRGIPWKGNYSSWLEQKQARLAQEEKSDKARQKTLERELEWIRMSPKGQHAKSKARISSFENLLSEESVQREKELEIYIPAGPRLGDLVAEVQGVSKAYGDKVLFEDLTFAIPRGGILGVIGANGAGKTTLFRMLAGEEAPDAGTIRIGETVKMAVVDQLREGLDPDKSVYEAVTGGSDLIEMGGKLVNGRAWMSKFGFSGESQTKKVRELSGGQQNRLNLALTLKSGANVLFFDEPTNDLDVNTMRALEEAVEAFAGSAVIISHDRWFLDRLATHILAFEGDSRVEFFDGNYSQYEAYRREQLGLDAGPHRIHYRKLTR
ncbi:energy-dependent translational throttle protein EttA [Mesoterricola silvestris]|uniref:Energy-dependent translational throttle protein EttA n=1 Tax=Mesoterricola silvestris TaxID=2927979 RepID=A0AA48K9C8_9BACT|nr:energy-dependent translational throttle protein EttA [Mesoterricola silvestris]BDU72965.1 energy-dependent translational throttle protein EttA [Mesoterricola silvestris]